MFKVGDMVVLSEVALGSVDTLWNALEGRILTITYIKEDGFLRFCEDKEDGFISYYPAGFKLARIPLNKLSKRLYPDYEEKDGYLYVR